MLVVQALFGLVVLTGFCWAISENRRAPILKIVLAGFALQIALAALFLKVAIFKQVFLWLNAAVGALSEATRVGTSFVFGYVGGGPLPFAESFPGASFILAFQALPLILVMSALSAVLFHWRILPMIVKGFAWVLGRTLNVGGAVGVSAAANVFVGHIEAPLFIRPYLMSLSRSELFMVMSGGMANVAGTVMVLYATFLTGIVPDPLGHILIASIVSTPAAIMIARIMVPETEGRATAGGETPMVSEYRGTVDAITRGTLDGVSLMINVAAMLLVLVALVSLANQLLGLAPGVAGAPLTLQRMLGWVMAPFAWLAGVPWAESGAAGALLGSKTVLNELIAYIELARLPEGTLGERSRLIMTYALCGFANLGSLGIMIGGLATMAPSRRADIVALGGRTLVSGTLATLVAGSVAGMFA